MYNNTQALGVSQRVPSKTFLAEPLRTALIHVLLWSCLNITIVKVLHTSVTVVVLTILTWGNTKSMCYSLYCPVTVCDLFTKVKKAWLYMM